MSARTVVLGDLHLVRETPAAVIDGFVRVVDQSAGARLTLVGDVFDLSADHPGAPRARAIAEAVNAQPRVRRALGEHLDRGGELWITSGNHDAALGEPDLRRTLEDALGLSADAASRLRTSPWFMRDGGVHFEHGHLFDPDNARVHPLVSGARSLGVHFVEEFVAPTGAFRFLNANDRPPLELLVSAFRWYGLRGPYVVFKYFDAAFRAALASGPRFRGEGEGPAGKTLEPGFAGEHGLSAELISQLVGLGAKPTMTSLRSTLARLYLDRVAATLTLAAGIGALALGRRRTAWWLLGLGSAAMGVSWALGHDRYGGTAREQLASGAAAIRKITGARLVVLGHAHLDVATDGYANSGSFAFPGAAPGRPYLEIGGPVECPRAERRYFTDAKRAG